MSGARVATNPVAASNRLKALLASAAAGEGASMVTYENGLTAQQWLPLDTMADLKAASALQIAGLVVHVLGRTVIGDAGEGHFVWRSGDQSANVAPDEVTTGEGDGIHWVAPDSDKTGTSGAWERISGGIIAADVTATVGTGGDFPTINDALRYLSVARAAYKNTGFTAEVQLRTGFVMEEQVKVLSSDLGWLSITSVDAEVSVARSTIPTGEGAWQADRLAVLPNFDAFFRMDATGTNTTARVFNVLRNSRINFVSGTAGGGGAAQRVLQVIHGSVCTGTAGVTLDGALDINLRLANTGVASIPFSTITNAAGGNVAAGSGAVLQAHQSTITGAGASNIVTSPGPALVIVNQSDLTGATNFAINAENVALVYAADADVTGGGIQSADGSYVDARRVTTGSGDILRVLRGGQMSVTGWTGLGTLDKVANLVTAAGVIWDENAVSENGGAYVGSGDGATVVFNIAHGLDATPDIVSVVPENTTCAEKHWVTRDATNIVIEFAAAPPSASNNLRFRWYAKIET